MENLQGFSIDRLVSDKFLFLYYKDIDCPRRVTRLKIVINEIVLEPTWRGRSSGSSMVVSRLNDLGEVSKWIDS